MVCKWLPWVAAHHVQFVLTDGLLFQSFISFMVSAISGRVCCMAVWASMVQQAEVGVGGQGGIDAVGISFFPLILLIRRLPVSAQQRVENAQHRVVAKPFGCVLGNGFDTY